MRRPTAPARGSPPTYSKRLFSRGEAISAMVLASLLARGRTDDTPHVFSLREELTWGRARLIRITTALAVHMVASVAAVISCQHACGLVDIDESQEAGAVLPRPPGNAS